MVYFYSEKGMRFFVLLMTFLVAWLFMGVSRAAFVCKARLPEDSRVVALKLCPEQGAKVDRVAAVLLVEAFAVKGE
ncbi:MAG: hypothetical protein WCT05_04940 [Lentisphaeria bacterium]